jgi:predicted DNA-binding transcriptional regulator YafY
VRATATPILHRIQWIDAQIRAGRYPNARSLAAACEISRRQALRDFEYLRDSLGAPPAYAALHRGFTLPPLILAQPVTPAQVKALDPLIREARAQEAATVALAKRSG